MIASLEDVLLAADSRLTEQRDHPLVRGKPQRPAGDGEPPRRGGLAGPAKADEQEQRGHLDDRAQRGTFSTLWCVSAGSVVWWLYGPPGAGKSTTAWELYANLLVGEPRAFFDVDQVGMCYPEPLADPGRYRLKARAASVLVRRFVRCGVRTVIVSGVADEIFLQEFGEQLCGVPVIFCRLRAGAGELRRRLQERYGPDDVARALAEAQRWDQRDPGPAVVDADRGAPREVARRVREAVGGLGATLPTAAVRSSSSTPPSDSSVSAGPGRALLLCGPAGVGKSTLGFGFFVELIGSGRMSAYVDLQQICFVTSVPFEEVDGHRVAAACVTDLWAEYRAVGARNLVLTGQVEQAEDVKHYRAALGDTPLLVCRLRAGREQLRERILARTRGEGPRLAGDTLVGLPADEAGTVLDLALAQQDRLERADISDVMLDTDRLDPASAVHKLSALLHL